MKKVFFGLIIVFISFSIFSCGSKIPQHCPSYASAYHKITKQKTRGVNKNVMDNGYRVYRLKNK